MTKLTNNAQWVRQFELIKQANQKCADVYPDDFHHKLKMREESARLSAGLKQGRDLVVELIGDGGALADEQRAKNKAFKRAAKFFIKHLDDVVENISQIEQMKKGGADE
ncbi:hypothetical protein HPC38_05010 [Pasteurellaceae bacterium HPA106]|uniref:hypothetical protein n=1 Tax=Spirabiliibacterium pneumoniae TaxID=221400 RepID=UPI001AAD60CB|nr:hypothetical protein [Spirabiliibacterium pneumoniae]MBE2896234.1 hypothetical protein [Spirabiliibacterium pneumoniae]